MRGDWKTADEIRADLSSGKVDASKLVIDLWERVDELSREVRRLKAKQADSN